MEARRKSISSNWNGLMASGAPQEFQDNEALKLTNEGAG
jgi:hypothetical protein